MFRGTADGTMLPPYIVFKDELFYEAWTSRSPKGTRYNRSKSGWFTPEIFEDWFKTIALAHFKTTLGIHQPRIVVFETV